ncbi:unnamed protein product [Staurois parvus]|uniref:Replication associated protein n=1 Tax=Staurois parvus TaxID=386267 RepID=A0ABN9CBN6_9NEOB|nr:unnamed protein product [Staurois parvus]
MGPLCPCPNSKKPMKKYVFAWWEETKNLERNPSSHMKSVQTPYRL